MHYFENSQEDLDLVELNPVPEGEKSQTVPGDALSFDGLEDRRFEVLAYKLTTAEPGGTRVRLMSGVRDKGRDIVVYSDTGEVTAIKQCKKYRDRLDEPTVRRELLKLALHSYREPAILGSRQITYELWCPGGLFETAESLFFEWPTRWTASSLAGDAAKVLREYAAFGELTWDEVKEYVVTEFPRIVTPRRLGAIDISGLVKKHPVIFEEFFQVVAVIRTQDVRDFFSQLGFAELTDDHARHVLGRIKSFPPEQRLVTMSSVVLGLTHNLVAKLRRAEYEAFATLIAQSTYGFNQIIMTVCARVQLDMCTEFRIRVRPENINLPAVLGQVLVFSMLARLNTLTMPTLHMQPGLETYDALTLDQRFEKHIREMWDSLQLCLAGYDPAKHAAGSNEELRYRIARAGLDGFATREQFEGSLRGAVVTHRRDIEETFNQYMSLVPTQIVMISDTVSIFENDWLFRKNVESDAVLQKLRGSTIIPE